MIVGSQKRGLVARIQITIMRTAPPAIQLQNAEMMPRTSTKARPSYLKQCAAHGCAIYHGLRLSLRAALEGSAADHASERKKLGDLCRWYISLLASWGLLDAEFSGFEEASKWRGSIIAANHPSLFDAILMVSILPDVRCIMNSRLLRDPVMSGAPKLCGYIRNDTRFSMVRDSCRTLSSGENLLVFPEGTRSTGNPIGPFRHGYALAATRCSAPIRTVLIECDSDYLGRGFSFFYPTEECPIRFRVTAGPIFRAEENEDPKALSARVEKYFTDTLNREDKVLRRIS